MGVALYDSAENARASSPTMAVFNPELKEWKKVIVDKNEEIEMVYRVGDESQTNFVPVKPGFVDETAAVNDEEKQLRRVFEEFHLVKNEIQSENFDPDLIEAKLQAIHDFIMPLSQRNKELREKVTELYDEIKKLKLELQELREKFTHLEGDKDSILIGVIVKKAEEIIAGSYFDIDTSKSFVSLEDIVNKFKKPDKLIQQGFFTSKAKLDQARKRWDDLKDTYKWNQSEKLVWDMKQLRHQRNEIAHPDIKIKDVVELIESRRSDERAQQVLEQLLPLLRDTM